MPYLEAPSLDLLWCTKINDYRKVAQAIGFSEKSVPKPAMLFWREGAATKLESANLEPTNAGKARQLALGNPESVSVESQIHGLQQL
jgi:hypothetical protein